MSSAGGPTPGASTKGSQVGQALLPSGQCLGEGGCPSLWDWNDFYVIETHCLVALLRGVTGMDFKPRGIQS